MNILIYFIVLVVFAILFGYIGNYIIRKEAERDTERCLKELIDEYEKKGRNKK